MTTSWDWKKNISQVLIERTANPNTGTPPPQVVRGALYQGAPDDPNIYLYGGTTSFLNTSFPNYTDPYTNQYSLWSYDTGKDTWNQFDVTRNARLRPNSGGWTDAPDLGLAFYFNGKIDNGSEPGTASLDDRDQFLGGMVVLDTKTRQVKNVSTDAVSPGTGRVRSQMVYLPAVGKKGSLVVIGGGTKDVGDLSDTEMGTLVGSVMSTFRTRLT